jgi:hypothetical protein
MQNILKLNAQIRALNKKIETNNTQNVYAVKQKIKNLKAKLKVESENYEWENYLSK